MCVLVCVCVCVCSNNSAAHVPYLQVVTLPGIQPFFVARNKATVQSDAKLEPLLAASMGVAKKRLAGSIEVSMPAAAA